MRERAAESLNPKMGGMGAEAPTRAGARVTGALTAMTCITKVSSVLVLTD